MAGGTREEHVDHRRATAERNSAAIVDAAGRLLAQRRRLTMAAVAAEAGVSRVTLYAHFKGIPEVLEALVARVIDESVAAVDAARPEEGPADAALERMVETSWSVLAAQQALAGAAAQHLTGAQLTRAHAPLLKRLQALVVRGQGEGAFRTDMPADWLVTAFFALVHAADERARSGGGSRKAALELVRTTLVELFGNR